MAIRQLVVELWADPSPPAPWVRYAILKDSPLPRGIGSGALDLMSFPVSRVPPDSGMDFVGMGLQ